MLWDWFNKRKSKTTEGVVPSESFGNRLAPEVFNTRGIHWSDAIAEELLRLFPKREVFTCAAGISPSGIVHFGNFRDVITSVAVAEALKLRGKKVRLVFSWDDFDRLRKVPQGIPDSFSEHIGKPLSVIPAPSGAGSYAEYFERNFESAMGTLGIDITFIYQNREYASGRYDELIKKVLQRRCEIADILLSFMTEKGKGEKNISDSEYRENFYPISVYSRFSGKDNTKILSYDGNTSVTYKCFDTGKTETIDFTKDRVVKLVWKADWPMRWMVEGVVFEPGGRDHASPGGSYDVASTVAKKIFDYEPPVFAGYDFVGITGQGTKMSGSKGNAVSPAELLEIYEPTLLRWLYMRKSPDQPFNLSFGSEVYRQYEELDREYQRYRSGELSAIEKRALELSAKEGIPKMQPLPFRQAVSFGQIVQWQHDKLLTLLESLNFHYEEYSITSRFSRAKTWLLRYNPEEIIKVRDELNQEYINSMDEEAKEKIRKLGAALQKGLPALADLEILLYDIPKNPNLSPKENSVRQRAFFKDVYNLLISADTGPRLSTFLSALDLSRVLRLLEV